MSLDILFAKNLDTSSIVHISEIPTSRRGRKCNCVCCECGNPLDAKLGHGKRHPHFAHSFKSNKCSPYAGETSLHQYAKDLIVKAGKLWVPAVQYKHGLNVCDYDSMSELTAEFMEDFIPSLDAHFVNICDPVKEKIIKHGESFFKPDVFLHAAGDSLCIEFYVTHRVSDRKKKALYAEKLSTLEIDLSQFKCSFSKLDKSEIDAIILGESSLKQWIYHNSAWHAVWDSHNLADLLHLRTWPYVKVIGIGKKSFGDREIATITYAYRFKESEYASGRAQGIALDNTSFSLDYLKKYNKVLPNVGELIRLKYNFEKKQVVGYYEVNSNL